MSLDRRHRPPSAVTADRPGPSTTDPATRPPTPAARPPTPAARPSARPGGGDVQRNRNRPERGRRRTSSASACAVTPLEYLRRHGHEEPAATGSQGQAPGQGAGPAGAWEPRRAPAL